ncbi:MAG: sulfite exporter TauE/SafE family protein [Actinobacteria bacterium]|nr:sulfite exporter TauE/SafE family protein [Actinomycetota bacterium]MBU1944252.1 sulfite exporter TauE/SafE family protein [Actinomycetota bacterium]MBU2688007.1 sulfite exporter TauE/SafE family protein [Actinomycetota bacterium]
MLVLGVTVAALLVSMVFSMVGGGGSQVLVPVLFWMGLDFKTGAIPLGLLAAATTCFSAAGVYWRRGLILKEAAWPFLVSVAAGAPLGALIHSSASSKMLMIVFAVSNIVVGLGVLRGKSVVGHKVSRRSVIVLGLVFGLAVGFFIGLIGRDGGPFVMAALVLAGYDAKESAATAVLVVAAGCLIAFLVHLPRATVGWELMLAACLASLVGSQIGSRLMTERMDAKAVRILFAAVMSVVGIVILVQAL